MSAGLTLLSIDDELTRLRDRIVQLTRLAKPEQRMAATGQLEAIDIERDRRLSTPATRGVFILSAAAKLLDPGPYNDVVYSTPSKKLLISLIIS